MLTGTRPWEFQQFPESSYNSPAFFSMWSPRLLYRKQCLWIRPLCARCCVLGSCGRVIEAGQVSQVHVVLPCLCCLLPLFRAEVGCGQYGWECAAAILQVGQSTWIQFQPNLSMAFARIFNTREFLQFPSLLYLILFSHLLFNQHSLTLLGVTALSICVYFSVLEGEGEFSILLFSHHLGPLQKLIFKRLKIYTGNSKQRRYIIYREK